MVLLGAAVGAPARYLMDQAVQRRFRKPFPLGTLTVNVTGSLVLGVLAGLPLHQTVMALLGTGFCGALTTYSTFGYETLRLAREGAKPLALLNIVGSLCCGLAAAYAGLLLAQGISA